MNDWRAYLRVEFWREHAALAAALCWGMLVFAVTMIASFPYQDALSAMLSPMGLRLTYETQHLSLPIGAELQDVKLVAANQPGGPALLESSELTLAPAIGSFLIGRPGLKIRAAIYDGEFAATVRRRRAALNVAFEARDLDVGRLRMLTRYGVNLGGQLSATGSMLVRGGGGLPASGQVQISAKGLAMRLGNGLPPLSFSNLNGNAKLEAGMLRIIGLRGSGPEGSFQAEGSVRLAPDLSDSSLELTLRLSPTPNGRARLGFLMGLLPHPPDNRPYIFRGILRAPSIS